MNPDLKVTTDGDSSRGWQYKLLQSPKAGLLPRTILLPFIIFFVGTGFLLGASWGKNGLRLTPGCSTFPKGKHISTSYAKSNTGEITNTFFRGHNADAPYPIAWLMSFPNSGTSYTSYLVRSVTGLHTATNYGTENIGEDGTSVAVFKDSPRGPFWSDPLNEKHVTPKSGSKGYLLTKTHCGGRCDQCPPEKYIENHQIFARRCLEGYYITKDNNGDSIEVLGSYNKDLVARAVHLIRDPFDNIVSRFHLTYKHFVKRNYTDRIAMYPRSKEGFRAFCKGLGDRYYEKEKDSKFFRDVFDDVKNIPCHADFFRYIQWHNLAFTTTCDLRIPTMIIHYENYTDNFNQTKEMLLDFLDQDDINGPPVFETGKTYRQYFTEEEVQTVSTVFSKLAMDETWNRTKHYFV